MASLYSPKMIQVAPQKVSKLENFLVKNALQRMAPGITPSQTSSEAWIKGADRALKGLLGVYMQKKEAEKKAARDKAIADAFASYNSSLQEPRRRAGTVGPPTTPPPALDHDEESQKRAGSIGLVYPDLERGGALAEVNQAAPFSVNEVGVRVPMTVTPNVEGGLPPADPMTAVPATPRPAAPPVAAAPAAPPMDRASMQLAQNEPGAAYRRQLQRENKLIGALMKAHPQMAQQMILQQMLRRQKIADEVETARQKFPYTKAGSGGVGENTKQYRDAIALQDQIFRDSGIRLPIQEVYGIVKTGASPSEKHAKESRVKALDLAAKVTSGTNAIYAQRPIALELQRRGVSAEKASQLSRDPTFVSRWVAETFARAMGVKLKDEQLQEKYSKKAATPAGAASSGFEAWRKGSPFGGSRGKDFREMWQNKPEQRQAIESHIKRSVPEEHRAALRNWLAGK